MKYVSTYYAISKKIVRFDTFKYQNNSKQKSVLMIIYRFIIHESSKHNIHETSLL